MGVEILPASVGVTPRLVRISNCWSISPSGRDLLAEGRLGDMQDFSGLSQTADIDDFHKIFQSS